MNTIEFLHALHPYLILLTAIATNSKERTGSEMIKTISLSYSNIKLRLEVQDKKDADSNLYLLASFQIDQEKVLLTDVYCKDTEKRKEFEEAIRSQMPPSAFLQSFTLEEDPFSKEVIHYLTIADAIAKQAYLCSSGDDYRPGYFSEIILEENRIVLRQINRHNSRSVDHKQDYHLRDLEFFIPLNDVAEKLSFQDEQIGAMRIHFSDGSSKNNKQCGDRIQKKINEERLRFDNR